MTVLTFPRIETTEVDGVPLLWATAPGPVTAALQFRVGRSDEQPPEAGITRAVEHLALLRLGQPAYEHGSLVEPTRTIFYAGGTDREMAEYLASVATAVADLPIDRLDAERETLVRQAEVRGTALGDAHRHFRFGLSAHGLPAQPEFGVGTVPADRILGWSRTAFGRRNAGAWLTAAPTAGLQLALPDGRYLPPPRPLPVPDVQWPAHLAPGTPGIGLGFLLGRERGAGTFVSILERRLGGRLDLADDGSSGILADYEPLDAAWAVGVIAIECPPDRNEAVVATVLGELDGLARGEATADELTREVVDLEQTLADEMSVAGLLDIMVRDRLMGVASRGPEERYEEQRATTADDIARSATQARASALLVADLPSRPDGFSAYPTASVEAVTGREIRPFLSVLGFGSRTRLVIGSDGVSIRSADGGVATVRYADCVILEKPSGEELVLWGRDGSRVYVPAAYWRGGDGLVAEIERALPADIVVRDRISVDLLD